VQLECRAAISEGFAETAHLVRREAIANDGGLVLRRYPESRLAFAIIMLGIGLWGLAQSGFVGIWAPGIQPAGLRTPMAAICSVISTVTGVGLMWRRWTLPVSRALFAFVLIWLIWCKGFALVRAPGELVSWESLGETAVIAAAAWALSLGLDRDLAEARPVARVFEAGPRILYGLALVAFGAAHFGYPALTASLVPAWLPWHLAWVYLTGTTYVLAGMALVAGRFARAAAILSALQMALFSVLVWLPRIAAGARDPGTLNETAVSFALAASGWVIATAVIRQRAGQRVTE
jgi:uncharacterized membrane protein